jgi:PEGA domain
MDSKPFDQSGDALLAFASEASIAQTADREPAFLRTPTPHDGHLSITSIAAEQPASPTVRGRSTTAAAVIMGVFAGFAGGYAFADRIVGPSVAPAPRVMAPAPPSAPALAPLTAPAWASASPTPRTEAPAEAPREPSVVKAAQATDARVAPAPSAPPAARRAAIAASTKRASAAARPRPEVSPTTPQSGAIEIVSRPRDAKVLLDGNFVGLAPMSIPNIPEGMHEVRVELDGFSPWVGAVRVKGGSRARVGASLQP